MNGVSTRAVDDLVAALGIESGISKSEVSRICAGLDEQVEAFRSRSLHHIAFPYVFLDATYLHVRRSGQVTSMAVVVATGVTAVGGREVLGLDVGDSEDEVFWRGFLRTLKQRGLSGVRPVISDQHAGLVAAMGRAFQRVGHQRCRVHFARNLLALVPKSHKDMVAAVFRTIFAQPDPATVAATWDSVRYELAAAFPRIGPLMDGAKAEVLAFTTFPRNHWSKIWSTNPLERVNKEIKRRARVVGIFPNEPAVIRLVGAVLADMHDEWQVSDRRYLSEGSMAKINTIGDNRTVASISGWLVPTSRIPESPPLSGTQPCVDPEPRIFAGFFKPIRLQYARRAQARARTNPRPPAICYPRAGLHRVLVVQIFVRSATGSPHLAAIDTTDRDELYSDQSVAFALS